MVIETVVILIYQRVSVRNIWLQKLGASTQQWQQIIEAKLLLRSPFDSFPVAASRMSSDDETTRGGGRGEGDKHVIQEHIMTYIMLPYMILQAHALVDINLKSHFE